MITYKNEAEIAKIRAAGRVLFETMQEIKAAVKPGVSTYDLDQIAEAAIVRRGGRPSEKGYNGYPGSICASVDAEVVHGIPLRSTLLREGQIVSIDCTVELDGYQADMARTFAVGKIDPSAQLFVDRTREAFYQGIRFAKVGYRIGDISSAIQSYVESFGYGVVRVLCGHGIGQEMHEDPEVPNYGHQGRGPRLVPGMTIAIEPMICQGDYKIKQLSDGWTVKTKDGGLAAHFEHSIAILKDRTEIMTRSWDDPDFDPATFSLK